ncbi:MAG: rRNA pseudouridine synthase [Pirellulales bacterium]|nr:rRNA pseudouridine synthase [Pirellulales bacterium]
MTQRPSVRRGTTKKVAADSVAVRGERLQKVLAAAGIGSRRECESLIQEGRVEVDRQVVTQLGTRVDADRQEVRLDGVVLRQPRSVYLALNKPPGVVSTNRDPQGRQRVVDLVPNDIRLFSVGRLDRFSEGLLVLTNDGDLANRLTHPRYGVEKTYRVRVAGNPSVESIRQLRHGVYLAEGFARVASVRIKKRHGKSTELEIVLDEGRNREVRRLLARIGHKVIQLCRVAIGPLRLGEMPAGSYRQLTQREVRQLRSAVDGGGQGRQATVRGRPGTRPAKGKDAGGEAAARKPAGRQSSGRETSGSKVARRQPGGQGTPQTKPKARQTTGRVILPAEPTGRVITGDEGTEHPGSGRSAGGSSSTGRKPTGRKTSGSGAGGSSSTGRKPTGRKTSGRGASGTKPAGGKSTGRRPLGSKQGGRKPTGQATSGSKSTGRSSSKRTQAKGVAGRVPRKKTAKRRS